MALLAQRVQLHFLTTSTDTGFTRCEDPEITVDPLSYFLPAGVHSPHYLQRAELLVRGAAVWCSSSRRGQYRPQETEGGERGLTPTQAKIMWVTLVECNVWTIGRFSHGNKRYLGQILPSSTPPLPHAMLFVRNDLLPFRMTFHRGGGSE